MIDGAHHGSRAFVAGRAIGDHCGGFTRFSHEGCIDTAGTVDVLLLVDNRFDPIRSPLHMQYTLSEPALVHRFVRNDDRQ